MYQKMRLGLMLVSGSDLNFLDAEIRKIFYQLDSLDQRVLGL